MAESEVNGLTGLDREELRRSLHSSSTKTRIAELDAMRARLSRGSLPERETAYFLSVLFDTYPFYIDRPSRRAAGRCLQSIAGSPDAAEVLASFIASLQAESAKNSIAPGNAFVLIEWCSILLQCCAANPGLWARHGSSIVGSNAHVLEYCIGAVDRGSMRQSAIVITRRALRKVLRSDELGAAALDVMLDKLCTKGSSSSAGNAVLLGVIAGVAARLPDVRPALETQKSAYLSFYIREILGSRIVLPSHIAGGLRDFFSAFATRGDTDAELLPAVEKGLLRSPEVILSGILQSLLSSLPSDLDQSGLLLNGLLKPLLTNVKSTNPDIRSGALAAVVTAVARCKQEDNLLKIVDEVLNPLQQGKIAAADQRLLHAQMLAAFPASPKVSEKIVRGLIPVALKEQNEAGAIAEIETVATHMPSLLSTSATLDDSILDGFKKGLGEKKIPVRKAWARGFSDLIWKADGNQLQSPGLTALCKHAIPRLNDTWNEVLVNPSAATQNGLIAVGYIFAALGLSKLHKAGDETIRNIIHKAQISKQLLIAEPKPSFLLNFRLYSKISASQDFAWGLRALASLTESIANQPADDEVEDAWSQAFIFFVSSITVPKDVRKEATVLLSGLYCRYPDRIGNIIIKGIWQWRRRVALGFKDTAAFTSKTGNDQLYIALRCVCPSPEERVKSNFAADDEAVRSQLVHLLVLCRTQMIPRAHWIDNCISTGFDPGQLVSSNLEQCLVEVTENTSRLPADQNAADQHYAACAAAADLAFVASDVAIPAIVKLLETSLDPAQLREVGPTEAGIFRSPDDTPFVDVLSSKAQTPTVDKNVKDYDTLKWEAELRAQLAQKKGQTRKLTPAEQAKVREQLAKEAEIRKNVEGLAVRLRRGVGIVQGLATGPPTEAEHWIVPAIDLLIGVIDAGAGLILDDAAALAYIACAERVSVRLGLLRSFIGIATLRAIGVTQLDPELQEEPLENLVTRVLYRLRMLGEHMSFDTVSLAYVFPLIFIVLERGGIANQGSEAADEQLVLAVEFLSLHADACADNRLPREKLLLTIISAMQRFAQHFELLKTYFQDLVRAIATNLSSSETKVLLKATVLPARNVRNASLQAIDADLDLSELDFADEVWIACHDNVEENAELAKTIWEESAMHTSTNSAARMIPYLDTTDRPLRRAAAKALAEALKDHDDAFAGVITSLENLYTLKAKPVVPEKDKFGMPVKKELSDPWEVREGLAFALDEMAHSYEPESVVSLIHFLVEGGALADRHDSVRNAMIEAATKVIAASGKSQVEPLMEFFEETLESPNRDSKNYDKVNEAVVVLYGAVARHLPPGDHRLPKVVQRLLVTLQTPSEDVQYAVAMCLPPLVEASKDAAEDYTKQMLDELLRSKAYPAQRGAAYGLAGIVKGKGVSALREYRIMSTLKDASESKKDQIARQGVYLGYELLSMILGRIFEPYAIQVVPQLLAGFGDPNQDVRDACRDASQQLNRTLSSFAVQRILPLLLEGLEEQQWRSKKGACEMLGTMSHLSPNQLALRLPDIIPPLTVTLNDSHKEVRASANSALKQFGEVISNPEIKSVVGVLLKALSDPTKYTDEALDVLIKVQFLHFLDAPSLALVVRILERGLGDRSATKRKSAQIIASLAHLTDRKDILPHLPLLVAGLRIAVVDPVPATRATAAKALGSLIEKLGEDALPDLIPNLMATLKTDTGAGDRMGSAQALSEVLAGLGTTRLEETLPTLLQNAQSSKASVREGFMSLFMYLPLCFGNSFAGYLGKIIPPILAGLADEVESIRETALKAGRLLVKNFASRAVELLLPELEQGLADDSHRIRLSSVELVGDLLFNLTGISVKTDQDEEEEEATEAGASLLEVLGEERRNKVLSALFICRCDTSGLVRAEAIKVWKSLVATPRTLKELIPTLTQLIIRRLASSNMEQKVIAGNALGELMRKAGEGVMTTLVPTLEESLQTSVDTDERQGICIALRELISSASPDTLEDHEKTLISVVRLALVDPDEDVRDAAAEAFDSLQQILGKKAVDQVLPHLLSLLRTPEDAENALSALLTLLTDNARSNIILPNLLPSLLTPTMTAFNARAIASLAEVASGAMVRKLPNILNALMDNIIACKEEELKTELNASFDSVLLSVDEHDGLSAAMSVLLGLAKHDDHRKRCVTDLHLAHFFAHAEVDISRYYPDLIRALLIAFDDSDIEVVKAAWTALNEMTKRLRKEDMESLVIPTRQVLQQVGVPGSNLPGFGLPKGINAILPIFLQGLMNGTVDQRTQAALAIADIIDRIEGESLKPFVTQITGPLIRVVSERSVDVKAAILFTLNHLLEKIPTYLKPFLPQLQRTFAKSLADTSSEILRTRAAKALGTLITMTPRVDPLIAELVTGSKTSHAGVKTAMLKALYEVVSKAGGNMNEASRSAILSLIDTEHEGEDDSTAITNARLLGALIKVLPLEVASSLVKSRVLTAHPTKESVLALNAMLVDSPETLARAFADDTVTTISRGISDSRPVVADNCVLAAGKYLLGDAMDKSFDATKPIFEALAPMIQPGNSVDTRRLALVVIRTVARTRNDSIRPHIPLLAPPVFASVRDAVIPVKLSAEAAFLTIFSVVDEDSAVFDKYMSGPGAGLPANLKRSMQEYFKRIATRLALQARERKDAEGGQGGLGLSNDEREDEMEIWSVGRVDLGEGGFGEI